MQAERAERRALGHEAPDQLGGQVLGLGGAAAVADGQQPPAREHVARAARPSARSGRRRPRARRARPAGCAGGGAGPGRAAVRPRRARRSGATAPGDARRRRGSRPRCGPSRTPPRAPHARPGRRRRGGRGRRAAARGLGEAVGIARADVDAGDAVDDRVDHPAHGGGDNRHAARHRLERDDPERLVPGHAHDGVGRAQQRRDVGARPTRPRSSTRSATPFPPRAPQPPASGSRRSSRAAARRR